MVIMFLYTQQIFLSSWQNLGKEVIVFCDRTVSNGHMLHWQEDNQIQDFATSKHHHRAQYRDTKKPSVSSPFDIKIVCLSTLKM